MSLTGPATGQPDPVVLSSMTDDLVGTSSLLNLAIGSAAQAANRATFVPVWLSQRHTYVSAWWLNGTVVNGNVDVGIYTRSGTTLTRVVASTAEAQATASVMQVATTFTTTTIGPGLYYLAICQSSATATFWRVSMSNAAQARLCGVFTADTAHPLPSTATAVAPGQFAIPVFGFSEVSAI